MKTITMASIQPPDFGMKSDQINGQTIEQAFYWLEAAMSSGTTLAVLPEFFNVFAVEPEEMLRVSANQEQILERCSAVCRTYKAYIVLPLLYKDQGIYKNRAYLLGPEGKSLGYYDKIHPTKGERSTLGVVEGDDLVVIETEIGRIGLSICYDIYFPELFSALTRLRPDVICFPSLQRSDNESACAAMLQTRAMDTKAYVMRSSYGCPLESAWKPGMMFGGSGIVHPDGTILGAAGHYEGIALAHVPFPFEWKRQRCSGHAPQSVYDFLEEDRRQDLFSQTIENS